MFKENSSQLKELMIETSEELWAVFSRLEFIQVTTAWYLGTPVLVLSKEIQMLWTIHLVSLCLELHIDMGRSLPDHKSLTSVTLQYFHRLCDPI